MYSPQSEFKSEKKKKSRSVFQCLSQKETKSSVYSIWLQLVMLINLKKSTIIITIIKIIKLHLMIKTINLNISLFLTHKYEQSSDSDC